MENVEQRVKKIVAEQLGCTSGDQERISFVDDLGRTRSTRRAVMALEEDSRRRFRMRR